MSSLPSTWVNRTGVPVKFFDHAGMVMTTLEPVAPAAVTQGAEVQHEAAVIGGDLIPLVRRYSGALVNLPEPQADVGIIVSREVARAAEHVREDLWEPYDLVPDMGDGSVGCRALIQHVAGAPQ